MNPYVDVNVTCNGNSNALINIPHMHAVYACKLTD